MSDKTRMRSRDTQHHRGRAMVLTAMAALLFAGCTTEVQTQRAGPVTTGPIAASPTVAVPNPAKTPALAGMPKSKPVRLRVPSISVDTPLMDLGLQQDGTLEVPPDGKIAGWYTQAPTPGEIGPAVIAAHVDWNGQPGVFDKLHELTPGAQILVTRQDGTTAIFFVTQVKQYPKHNFPSDDVYGNIDHAGLRLITCGGAFDKRARSYEDNVVAYARLLTPKTG